MGFLSFEKNEYQQGLTYENIRINLSEYCTQIIKQDLFTLNAASVQTGNKKSLRNRSNYICTVFINAHKAGLNAFIGKRLELLRMEYNELFHSSLSVPDKKIIDEIIDIILEEERKKLSQQINLLRKNKFEIKTFFLNSEFFTYLMTHNFSEEDQLYPSLPLFIKAVIEEYCRLPYYQRERIFFLDTVQTLNNIAEKNKLDSKNVLKFPPTKGKKYRTVSIILNGNKSNYFNVIPFGIETDIQKNYNYLVCLSKDKESDKFIPCYYRLSRIERIVSIDSITENMIIPVEHQKKINEWLETGCPVSQSRKFTIKVRLSKTGEKMYSQIQHLRPELISADRDIYTFFCTKDQALKYFLRLGAEAVILEPVDLRQKMTAIYKKALDNYANI